VMPCPMLSRVVSIFEKMKTKQATILTAIISWINEFPFESPGDFRNAGEVLDKILIETGSNSKIFLGEYGTPEIVIQMMTELVDPKPGDRIYDPCFGTGGLLLACARRIRDKSTQLPPRAWIDVQKNSIYGVEKNLLAYVIGLARLTLTGIQSPGLELGNTLERPVGSNQTAEKFDCILANPPWGGRPPTETLSHYPIKSADTLGLFVQHVMHSLKPNGRAVIAVPTGFLFKTGPDRMIRRHLLEKFRVDGIISIPSGTFMPYTSIESNLLVIRRDPPGKDVRFMQIQKFESPKKQNDFAALREETELYVEKSKSLCCFLNI